MLIGFTEYERGKAGKWKGGKGERKGEGESEGKELDLCNHKIDYKCMEY